MIQDLQCYHSPSIFDWYLNQRDIILQYLLFWYNFLKVYLPKKKSSNICFQCNGNVYIQNPIN